MTASDAIAVTRAVEALLRQDRGRLLAALIARLRDFQLAEDALQEAALSALTHWGRAGIPASPQGWLLRVALRKAIDRIRAGQRDDRKSADLARLAMQVSGLHGEIALHPAPAGSVRRRVPDIAKLRRLIGFTEKVSLEEGLARTAAYYLRRDVAPPAPR
jgi:DNA-directed RNA polymerase specialized sigma24 family protein